MPHNKMFIAAWVLAIGLIRAAVAGDGTGPCQNCQAPDGCCYHNVTKYRCVLVPDKKQIKKTVFDCKDVPYCVHRLPKLGECHCCPECQSCPRFKKVLIKRDIVVCEVCTTKCVVEEYCEQVLGPCCKCGHDPQCTNKDAAPEVTPVAPDVSPVAPDASPVVPPPMPPPDIKAVSQPTVTEAMPPVIIR